MVSEEIRAMIPDYVRGLLSPLEAKEVEAAVASFPEISQDFEAARAYYSALNQIPEVRAPADFMDRVNHGIDHKPLWPGVRKFLFEPLHIKLPIEFAAVAASLIIMLAIKNPFMPKEQLFATNAAPVARYHEPEVSSVPAESARPVVKKEQEAAIAMVEEAKADQKRADRRLAVAAPTPDIDKRNNIRTAPDVALAKMEKPDNAPSAGAAAAPAPIASAPMPAARPSPAPAAHSSSAQAYAAALPMLAASKAKATEVKESAAPLPQPAAEPAVARAVSAPVEEAATVEEIGTIELSYVSPENEELKKAADMSAEAASPARATNPTAIAATILNTYDPQFKKTVKNGKVTFLCTFPPDRLTALIDELGKPFNVTTQLFPYDTKTTKLVTVTFVVR
jgi:hypothetical protein